MFSGQRTDVFSTATDVCSATSTRVALVFHLIASGMWPRDPGSADRPCPSPRFHLQLWTRASLSLSRGTRSLSSLPFTSTRLFDCGRVVDFSFRLFVPFEIVGLQGGLCYFFTTLEANLSPLRSQRRIFLRPRPAHILIRRFRNKTMINRLIFRSCWWIHTQI